ncbi:hypothetical protein TSOC_008540 [Tetrabaena socialis]|uniref:Cyclic nucleotide-binding domain-containing protein n=1 Tax=Tetrabaena socialis TaxID=47790 RepID=A0A2J7ZY83_9CHLO|nr:hypothetical protein TSOC_008540 [Tetrabaena socialis]|eukprot:PNH05215.1 hypothetical protein TSOC_008540 [Tetrabaena socialis]
MASGVAAAQAAEAAALPPRRQWRMLYSDSVPFKHVRTLKPNSFFGEYGCLTGCPRTASVVARRASELYVLVRADLAAALGGWADLRAVWQQPQLQGQVRVQTVGARGAGVAIAAEEAGSWLMQVRGTSGSSVAPYE